VTESLITYAWLVIIIYPFSVPPLHYPPNLDKDDLPPVHALLQLISVLRLGVYDEHLSQQDAPKKVSFPLFLHQQNNNNAGKDNIDDFTE